MLPPKGRITVLQHIVVFMICRYQATSVLSAPIRGPNIFIPILDKERVVLHVRMSARGLA